MEIRHEYHACFVFEKWSNLIRGRGGLLLLLFVVTLGGGALPAAKRRLWALHTELGMCGESRECFVLVITHPPTLGEV
jgi:hypothetical protein